MKLVDAQQKLQIRENVNKRIGMCENFKSSSRKGKEVDDGH